MKTLLGFLIAVLLTGTGAQATPKTWTGNGDWFANPGNWNPEPPVSGDAVVVTSGNLGLTNSTPALASFTLNGGTVTMTRWTTCIAATEVTLNGGNLTCTGEFLTGAMSNRVFIACANLTINSGGKIDVSSRGYRRGIGTTGFFHGQGPGGGYSYGNYGGGGGHGGAGGLSYGAYGRANGETENPATPGSGGARYNWGDGGNGGGAVWIEASGAVKIVGSILANGATGAGGGSGGSVRIACRTFEGTGQVRANGGNGEMGATLDRNGGGGSGGRIAVRYETEAQAAVNAVALPTVTFSANNGIGSASLQGTGMPGTLYISDNSFFPTTTLPGGVIIIPGFTSWSPASLLISEGLSGFPSGFALNVAGSVSILGSGGLAISNVAITVGGNLTISNTSARVQSFVEGGSDFAMQIGGSFHVDKGSVVLNRLRRGSNFDLLVGENLRLRNDALLYVFSGPTNTPAGRGYGLLLDVGRDILIEGTSALIPYTFGSSVGDGGAPWIKARHLMVAQNARINAAGTGYQSGGHDADGLGPGKGKRGGPSGGAGHGGTAGWVVDATYGKAFGSSTAPITGGSSGGGTPWSGGGAPGGGVIYVNVSGNAEIYGTLTADGVNGTARHERAGGGAGGTINLMCRALSGTGVITAKGGSATNASNNGGGGGGGGRIALYTIRRDQWTGSTLNKVTLVPGGLGNAGNGREGTLHMVDLPAPGTLISIR